MTAAVLADLAPIVADGFVTVRSQDEHVGADRVRQLAERFGLVWSGTSTKEHAVTVLGIRDGSLWVGTLSYAVGLPIALPALPEDADLPKYGRAETRYERTVTVRASWTRPADHSEWRDWIGKRFDPFLSAELDRMSPEHRAQWSVPVTGKGETVAAFKVAPRCGKVAAKKATPRHDGGLRFTYQVSGYADSAAEQGAMVGRMRELGARVGCEVRHEPAHKGAIRAEGPTLSRIEYEPYTATTETAPVARAPRKSTTAPSSPVLEPATYPAVTRMLLELADSAVNRREATALMQAAHAIDSAQRAHHERKSA